MGKTIAKYTIFALYVAMIAVACTIYGWKAAAITWLAGVFYAAFALLEYIGEKDD